MLAPLWLDDQSFEELYAAALEKLPSLAPEWTDYNTHDPGITLLELFCWLTEMQRFHLTRITDRHERKFLKLLGTQIAPVRPARLLVLADGEPEVTLPCGARADIGGIPFTLPYGTRLGGLTVTFSRTMEGAAEETRGFRLFGEKPAVDSCFYMTLTPPREVLGLYLRLYEYTRNPPDEHFYPLCETVVELWNGGEWIPCDWTDETQGFIQSGFIHIRLPKATDEACVLRFRLTRCDIDAPPVLEWASANAAELEQYDLYCESVTNEETHLSNTGYKIAVLVKEMDGWCLGDGGEESASGMLTVYADTPFRRIVFDGDENPVCLETTHCVVDAEHFSLMAEDGGLLRAWTATEDLSCHGPDAGVYELDAANGRVYFGDGEHGKRPGKTILITSLRVTMGARGNVKENLTFTIESRGITQIVRNPCPAEGGNDGESTAAAFERIAEELRQPCRAVRINDYLSLALQTPGLSIETAAAYVNAGKVNICVQPRYGTLSPAYAHNLRSRLFARKLPCAEISIVPPVLWEGAVFADIRLMPWAADREAAFLQYAKDYFDAMRMSFGLRISLRQWTRGLAEPSYIRQVRELSLRWPNGDSVPYETDFDLPPNGLLRIASIQVRFTTAES